MMFNIFKILLFLIIIGCACFIIILVGVISINIFNQIYDLIITDQNIKLNVHDELIRIKELNIVEIIFLHNNSTVTIHKENKEFVKYIYIEYLINKNNMNSEIIFNNLTSQFVDNKLYLDAKYHYNNVLK